MVLPPGWIRLGVARTAEGDPAMEEIDAAIEEALAGGPWDSVAPLARQMRRRAESMLEQARDIGALDLYLPLHGVRGRPVAASFVVGQAELSAPPSDLGSAADVEVEAALVSRVLAAAPGGEGVGLRAGPAIRSRQILEPEALSDDPPVARIDYQLPVPGQPRHWIVVELHDGRSRVADRSGQRAAGGSVRRGDDDLALAARDKAVSWPRRSAAKVSGEVSAEGLSARDDRLG